MFIRINSIRYNNSVVDGPGIRTVLFMQGCDLHCKGCQNRSTWDIEKGKKVDIDELVNELTKKVFNKKITISGGEPLMQIDFLIELFILAKEKGINTCIDTAGGPFTKEGEWFEKFKKLMEVTDILLMDIKHINEEEHVKLTGVSGKNVVEMFRYLDEIKKPIWIRHVLTPGITDNDEYLTQTRDFIRTLSNVQRVEVLPYHGLGAMKYKELGIDYVLKDVESPTAERVANAKAILECDKYTAWRD